MASSSKDKGDGSGRSSPDSPKLSSFYLPIDPELIYLGDPDFECLEEGHRPICSFVKCKARFAGKPDEDVFDFMSEVDFHMHDTYMGPKAALEQLPLLLDGVAAEWWRCFGPRMQSWDEARVELLHHFGGRKSTISFVEQLRCRRQQPGESAADYIVDMQEIMIKLDPPPDEKHQVGFIIAGLLPSLAQKVMSKHNLSLKEISNEIIFAEGKLKPLGSGDP